MSWIYPDNANRYNRVTGLANDIGSIQQEVLDAIAREDAKNVQINVTLNQLLAKNNLKTIDEMKEKVMQSLTPEQRQAFEDLVNKMKNHDSQVDKILDASFMIGFISGLSALLVPRIYTLLNTGALSCGINLVARGFARMLRGAFAEGVELMRAGIRAGRVLAGNAALGADASRFIRFFRAAAKVLSIVSIVLDAVVLIYQAIEGAKQRDALREGILELFSRRQNCKTLEGQIFNAESYQGEVQGYLIVADTLAPGPARDQALAAISDNIITHVKEGLAVITDQWVWDKLHEQDKNGNAWTDEDPSLQRALDWIAAQPEN